MTRPLVSSASDHSTHLDRNQQPGYDQLPGAIIGQERVPGHQMRHDVTCHDDAPGVVSVADVVAGLTAECVLVT